MNKTNTIILSMLVLLTVITSKAQTYPVDSTTLNSASITGTVTLNGNTIYIMKGYNRVKNSGVIVINAGVLIQGDKPTNGTLIVERGGKIYAIGTFEKPITFTSRFPQGQRHAGDWGGVILCGRAGVNTVTGADSMSMEGLPAGQEVWFGGQPRNDADSSGILRYVRIEFAGVPLTPGNEINGLTMGGIGSKTVIDHIQVSYSGDDSYEWFGGTVNCKYLIAYKGLDDDFDTDNGYRGKCQFLWGMRDTGIADVSTSNGFETDNNANSPNNYNSPRTKPIYSNVTLVGPKKVLSWVVNPLFGRGTHERRNSLTSPFNSIIMGWPVGIRFDGQGVANACNGDTIRFQNLIYAGCPTLADTVSQGGNSFNGPNWIKTSAFNNRIYMTCDSAMLTDPFNIYGSNPNPNASPLTGSPALTGSSFSNAYLTDPFFTPVSYVGAFGPNDTWANGWTNFNPNYYDPKPIGIQLISGEVPTLFNLSQNYPNPFNPTTNIKFSLPVSGFVTINFYDAAGKEVKTIINENQKAGTYKVDFDGSNLASGVYFYKLTVNGIDNSSWSQTRKMILVK